MPDDLEPRVLTRTDTSSPDVPGQVEEQARHRRLNPTHLAYLMGPAALLVILLLMRFDLVVRESAWLWLAVFICIPVASLITDVLYRAHPSQVRLHARVAVQAAGGDHGDLSDRLGPGPLGRLRLPGPGERGPRRIPGLADHRPVEPARDRVRAGGHHRGVGCPPMLSIHEANALAVMGAFVLMFIIRMAGATMEQKEDAEASTRLSEDRFRSLIQNSSDMTLVMGTGGMCSYVSPAIEQLLGFEPSRADRPAGHRLRPSRRAGADPGPDGVAIAGLAGDGTRPVPDGAGGRYVARCRGGGRRSTRPPVGGGLCRQCSRHHRTKGVRGPAGPPGAPRSSHRPGQPAADPRPRRADAGPLAADASTRWPPTSSTSTTSRMPTTRSATKPATSCCRPWPAGSPVCCGPATRWAGWAGTSS